jgi:hypothetical protein
MDVLHCVSRVPVALGILSLRYRGKLCLHGKTLSCPCMSRSTVDQVLWMFATKCSCPESGVTCVMSQPQQDVYAPCVVGWIYCSFEVLSWMFA